MTLILSGTNGLSDVDGDASTPAVRGTDANSGIFFGADTVGVSTGGSEKVSVGASAVVVNDGGADVDFRVEGDTDANLLFVDASTDRVGIGTNTPSGLFDVASRGITKGSLPAGSVLQVVQGTGGASITTSTSYVDAGLSVSITPSSASSTVMAIAYCAGILNNGSGQIFFNLVRSSTQLAEGIWQGTNGRADGSMTFAYLDSPNTTSATTYKVQFRTTDASVAAYIGNGSTLSTIILMEIAA